MKSCSAARVEAVLSVDGKGQILLPKELREKTGIKAGDRLVVITGCSESGEVCCLILVKGEIIDEGVRGLVAPMLKEIVSE